MPAKIYKDIVELLTKKYPTFSKQLKKSAAYILDNPGDVATLSMRKVAAKADVPPATMNRLAKSIGFRTYTSFRDVYRNGIFDMTSSYTQKAGQLRERSSSSSFEQTLLSFREAAQFNLNQLFDSLRQSSLPEIVHLLLDAHHVIVVGMHASSSQASYLHYMATMCFHNWRLLAGQKGELAKNVAALHSDDVVIAISQNPCVTDTILMAKQARRVGAKVIGITDSRTTPIAGCSDFVFVTPDNSPNFFESHVSTTALLELLMGMLVATSGDDVIANLKNLESVRHELGEYWSGTSAELK